MTFVVPDPVPSGKPHKIISVDGVEPSAVEQFLGEVTFTVDRSGSPSEIRGVGSRDGDTVRFHEKDLAHTGKDVRTWRVSPAEDGQWAAVPTAPV